MEIKDFKNGDRIYSLYNGGLVDNLLIVERVTPTQIVCDSGHKFRIKNNRLDLIGRHYSWPIYSYSIETPELKEVYKRKKLISKIKSSMNKLKYSKVSLDDLNNINEILSKYE